MLGWLRSARICRSWRKRSASAEESKPPRTILMATACSYSASARTARYTVPMPPSPIASVMRKSPSTCPTRRAPAGASSFASAFSAEPFQNVCSSATWSLASSRSTAALSASSPAHSRDRKASRSEAGKSNALSKSSSSLAISLPWNLSLCAVRSGDRVLQPGSREAPVALHRAQRAFHALLPQHFRRLIRGQSAEEAQLHHLRLPGVFGRKAVERVIHHQDIEIDGLADVGQRDWLLAATSLRGISSPGVVHQDVPHHARGHGIKLRPALPVEALHVGQLQVQLMNQSGRLQSMAFRLLPEHGPRQAAEFLVDGI